MYSYLHLHFIINDGIIKTTYVITVTQTELYHQSFTIGSKRTRDKGQLESESKGAGDTSNAPQSGPHPSEVSHTDSFKCEVLQFILVNSSALDKHLN